MPIGVINRIESVTYECKSHSGIKNIMRPKVKVCGMTCPDNVNEVVKLGVDAIGVILHADSPRRVDVERAREIRAQVPIFVSLVGVFVDCDSDTINSLIDQIDLDIIQLHGSESNDFGVALDRPFIKAIRARDRKFVSDQIQLYPDARALLIDPYLKGQHGGTGKQISPELWPTKVDQKLILAGGLSPLNIDSSVDDLTPYAVDINSGVESSPGIKDISLVKQALNLI